MHPAEGSAVDDQAALTFEIAAMRMRASWEDLGQAPADVDEANAQAQLFGPVSVVPVASPSAHPGFAASKPEASFLQAPPAERLGAFAPVSAEDDEPALPFRRASSLGRKQRTALFALAGAIVCGGLWAAFSGSNKEPEMPPVASAPSADSPKALGASAETPSTAFVNSNGAGPRPQAVRPVVSEVSRRPARDERVSENRLRDARREVRARENEARKRRVAAAPEPAPRSARAGSDLENTRTAATKKRPIVESRPEPRPAPQRTEPARTSDAAKRKGTGFVSTNPY